jgi:hypothetical protein
MDLDEERLSLADAYAAFTERKAKAAEAGRLAARRHRPQAALGGAYSRPALCRAVAGVAWSSVRCSLPDDLERGLDLVVIFNLFSNRLDDRCCGSYSQNRIGPSEINNQRCGWLACKRLRRSANRTIQQLAARGDANCLVSGGRLAR